MASSSAAIFKLGGIRKCRIDELRHLGSSSAGVGTAPSATGRHQAGRGQSYQGVESCEQLWKLLTALGRGWGLIQKHEGLCFSSSKDQNRVQDS